MELRFSPGGEKDVGGTSSQKPKQPDPPGTQGNFWAPAFLCSRAPLTGGVVSSTEMASTRQVKDSPNRGRHAH